MWVRDLFKERKTQGAYNNLVREMRLGDREFYFKYMCMSPERFDHILSLIEPIVTKESTNFREPISAGERISITLRFLATGETQQSLSLSYRIGKATVSKVVRETSDAIYEVLSPIYMQPPKTQEDWLAIAKDFQEIWNLPNVIGSIDRKHVRMMCPANTGTLFHNYKGYFSLQFLGISDARYCFILIDLGQYGSNNDTVY